MAWICLLILSALSIRPPRLVATRLAASREPVRAAPSTIGAVVPLFSLPEAHPTRASAERSIASLIDLPSGQKLGIKDGLWLKHSKQPKGS